MRWEHAAHEYGREPAYPVCAVCCSCVAGPALGLGWRARQGLVVPICGPGLFQAVVEECWAHRGLLCWHWLVSASGLFWLDGHDEIQRRGLKSGCDLVEAASVPRR